MLLETLNDVLYTEEPMKKPFYYIKHFPIIFRSNVEYAYEEEINNNLPVDDKYKQEELEV